MAIEQYTEKLTLSEMKCTIGKNDFGYVFPQGDVSEVDKIERLLKQAGGKPKECALEDFSKGGSGRAKPEFVITFNDDTQTILVVECKKSVTKHRSAGLDHPRDFAVDGVLYYAKYLKAEYNVIAIAVSGTKKDNMRVDTFYWLKGQDDYSPLPKARDIILEPRNYVELVKGNRLQKSYSLDEIRETAINMHDYLREIKVTEAHKPIFIAGILIALNDEDFSKSYAVLTSYKAVMQNIQSAIENVLSVSTIKSSRVSYIKQVFKVLQENTKFSDIPLGHHKSITWYIEQLELKIKPMMDYADSTVDALGVFYHEFIKYSGGDGSGLGIVLTPQHLTEFMCDLANVNPNSRVVDICCGSGSFLVTAMSKMFKQANAKQVEHIRQDALYGVEFDDGLYTLAIANMIIRRDGKSNIYKGDCFNAQITRELKAKNINIGLINPPYSQTDKEELEFVEHLLDILAVGGTGVVVVPMSCAIGTRFQETRKRLLEKHTLKAVFSMPDDIFYPSGTNVCVMVWEAHTPHDSQQETFFGYYKNDGFAKRKKLGRIDVNGQWQSIEAQWLSLYRNRDVKDGLSARHCVTAQDEWLCEAYMKTDYSKLTQEDFQQTVNDYLAYLIRSQKQPAPVSAPDPSGWKEYLYSELFEIRRGESVYLIDCEAGDIPYASASSHNNGISAYTNLKNREGNCIVVNYDGSIGDAFYQSGPFFASEKVVTLTLKGRMLNKYIAMFLIPLIKAERFRFSYGSKWTVNKRMPNSVMRLPAKADGTPDFDFMEQYIRSLPYSDKI